MPFKAPSYRYIAFFLLSFYSPSGSHKSVPDCTVIEYDNYHVHVMTSPSTVDMTVAKEWCREYSIAAHLPRPFTWNSKQMLIKALKLTNEDSFIDASDRNVEGHWVDGEGRDVMDLIDWVSGGQPGADTDPDADYSSCYLQNGILKCSTRRISKERAAICFVPIHVGYYCVMGMSVDGIFSEKVCHECLKGQPCEKLVTCGEAQIRFKQMKRKGYIEIKCFKNNVEKL